MWSKKPSAWTNVPLGCEGHFAFNAGALNSYRGSDGEGYLMVELKVTLYMLRSSTLARSNSASRGGTSPVSRPSSIHNLAPDHFCQPLFYG
jgi:hypothetical protein